ERRAGRDHRRPGVPVLLARVAVARAAPEVGLAARAVRPVIRGRRVLRGVLALADDARLDRRRAPGDVALEMIPSLVPLGPVARRVAPAPPDRCGGPTQSDHESYGEAGGEKGGVDASAGECLTEEPAETGRHWGFSLAAGDKTCLSIGRGPPIPTPRS